MHQALAQSYYRLDRPSLALETAIVAAKTAKKENDVPLARAILEEAKTYRARLEPAPAP